VENCSTTKSGPKGVLFWVFVERNRKTLSGKDFTKYISLGLPFAQTNFQPILTLKSFESCSLENENFDFNSTQERRKI